MPRPTSTPLAATTSLPDGSAALRLYHLNPRLVGPLAAWPEQLARIAAMGFSGVLLAWPFATAAEDALATTDPDRLHPALGHDGPAADGLRAIAQACRAHGLACLLDLAIDRAATGSPLAAALPGCWRDAAPPWLDPRLPPTAGLRLATPLDTSQRAALLAFWQPRLLAWQASGIAGLRCHAADILPPDLWAALLEPLRSAPGWICIGWMPGQPRPALAEASGTFEYLPSSAAWWDGRAPWLAEEYHALRPLARLLACADDPAGPRLAARLPAAATLGAHRRALHAAAALADGWLLPMGFEFGARLPLLAADASPADFTAMQADAPFDLSDEIAAANAALAAAPPPPALRQLTAPGAAVTLLQRADAGACGHLVALNPGTGHPAAADLAGHAARLGAALDGPARVHLPPGGAAIVPLRPAAPIHAAPHTAPPAGPRLAIEAVTPSVENGRFAAKRIAGDTVVVEADIFTDGHDMIAAELRWRPADSDAWSTTPMLPLGNDRWQAGFPLARPGRHLFAIEAWWDHFATFRRDLVRKRDAGLDLALECQEGRMLLEDTLRHAAPAPRATIAAALAALPAAADPVALLLEDDLAQAMHAADPRPHRTGAETHYPVEADREAAIFASWYELFPRSVTDTPSRHGSFTDVITRLPAIRAMGFDVLYFPPIHPIGRVNRKGPNNTLTPGPDDPGSPYAIGGPEGGHDAIHPELGTREDFRRLVRAAAEHGLEIALDFAIQCAPDHPWLREHPDWFQWRPDGSMKYAENPPKKYQDIVNVDFYGPGAVPGLWLALRDVVQMWVDEGVRIFRVDNPHTKPFPFWEWLIADIRARDPGVLFFAEAFTRPKVMYRLGKIGFSQSYTYFTWRNTKAELTEYLDELNAAPARDLFRPNFFVNTPDINPVFLQTSGRPGFLIRAALAATLSGLWGLYSGFELCEAAALPGREEYLDSEKYQIRVRDYAAPGNIVAEITRLNEIRRGHPALRSHLGLTFRAAGNDQVLFYEKRVPDSADLILVAVSLDPHHAQTTSLELPLWSLGLPDDATVAVEDLMAGQRFTWSGKHQTVTLDPATLPFRVWRIAPQEAPQS